MAQWLRVCLPMQGTRVRAQVWEDPTCRGAAAPMSQNYWACASGACAPQGEAAMVRGPRTAMKSGPRLPQLEKALAQKRRPNTAISKLKKNKKAKNYNEISSHTFIMAIIKKSTNNKRWWRCEEKMEYPYTVGRNVNWWSHCGKQHGGATKN